MLTFEDFGAVGDGVTDDRAAFAAAAAGGFVVSGRPGSTYFIDINSYSDSISIGTGTDWDFNGSTIKWDGNGVPLFFFPEDQPSSTINNADILYDGVVAEKLPFSRSELDGYFGQNNFGAPGYQANFLVFGADQISIDNSSTSSSGPEQYNSVYAHIRLTSKDDGTRGDVFSANNISVSNANFGVLGSGFDEIRLTGNIVGGDYDDFSDFSWGAPGHLIYIAGSSGTSRLELGAIEDRGEYMGPDGDLEGISTLKIRGAENVTLESLISERPHGAVYLYDVQNAEFGSIVWESSEPSNLKPPVMIAASDNPTTDITFDRVEIDAPELLTDAIRVAGKTNAIHERIIFNQLKLNVPDPEDAVYARNVDEFLIREVVKIPSGHSDLSPVEEGDSFVQPEGAGDDKVTGGKNADIVEAGSGDDTVSGGRSDDSIKGEDGDDDLKGNRGDDTLEGGAGDDQVAGGLGNDAMFGGTGDDTLNGDRGHDSVVGNQGDDRILGNRGDDTLEGGAGDDQVAGGLGNDAMFGGTGNDILSGGRGDDSAVGNQGDDRILGNRGEDTLKGGAGDDQVVGGRGNDAMFGGTGNDILSGGRGDDSAVGNQGDDQIKGNRGDDTLEGGAGDDKIVGGRGNDVIVGGAGNDQSAGGRGADTFVFVFGDDGTDTIQDFDGFNDTVVAVGFGNDSISMIQKSSDVFLFAGDSEIAILRNVGLDELQIGINVLEVSEFEI